MPGRSAAADGPILILSGTNRPNSHAMKVAKCLETEYRTAQAPAEIFSMVDLPQEIFEGAAYAKKPARMVALQERILAAAGLHIVTPEYNGSFPGVLKYFIDMLKFPESFESKCVAFVGESHGTWGGLRSVEHLIQIFHYRNAHVYPDRVFIPSVQSRFDGEDRLNDESIRERLQNQVAGFIQFIGRLKAAK